MVSVEEMLAAARQFQQIGQPAQAERLCRQVAERNGIDLDVWLQLGSVYQALGNFAEAESCYRRVLQQQPGRAQVHNSLGIVFARQGRRPEAAACFTEAVRLQPDLAVAHNNLGNILKEQGRLEEALKRYETAVALKPDFADGHNNLGSALRNLGRFEAAALSCRRALALQPNVAEAHNNLGAALAGLKRWDEAVASYREALRLQPQQASVHNNLGAALAELDRLDEAAASLREAIRLRPTWADAHNNLGNVLRRLERLDEAASAYREAVRLQPDLADGHNNLALTFADLGQTDAALASYERALQLRPESSEYHKNRALTLLAQGDLQRGWAEFEWRWGCAELPVRPLGRPEWDGAPLNGRTILLHAEQGLGDTLHFVRYVPLVRQRGGKVVLAVQRALVPLLRGLGGVESLVAQGDTLPAFDVHAPLLSLPRIFGTTLDNIPAAVPYLAADPALVEHWKRELGALASLRELSSWRIGIAWHGSATHKRNRQRSIPLAHFAALAQVPGVQLFSLQKGPGQEQLAEVAGRFAVVDLGRRLDEQTGPFLDTAAVMKNLDLVICCDSAPAHLAGALGVPVWVGLSFAPDWRWLQGREDSPWYPTMRLFRQPRPGAWDKVFERMAEALRQRVALPRGSQHRDPSKQPTAGSVLVEVAVGELIDKITILEIKNEQITDAAKLANVRRELDTLRAAHMQALPQPPAEMSRLTAELKSINMQLWHIEDDIRRCEAANDFGPRFIELARSVYRTNDRRAAVKRRINELLGSRLVEEKAYQDYGHAAAATLPTLAAARQCHQSGNFAQAERIYRQLLDADRTQDQVWYLLGACCQSLGKLDEAVSSMRQALQLGPQHVEAHNHLGVLLAQQGEREEAMECFRQAIQLRPSFAEAHRNLGLAQKDLGRVDEATASYRQALTLQPRYPEALHDLGQVQMLQNRLDDAVASFHQALQLKPDLTRAQHSLRQVLQQQGKPDEALAVYRQALAQQPDAFETRLELGRALLEQGKSGEAVAVLREAVRCATAVSTVQQAEAHNLLGFALNNQEKYDEALASLAQALWLKPDFPLALNNRGIVLRHKGRAADAEASCREAMRLLPEFAEAHNNLGLALLEQNRLAEGLDALREAVRLKPAFAQAHNNLAIAFWRSQRYEEARAAYEEALRLKPDFAAAHNNLANVHRDLLQLDRALECFAKASTLDPNYVDPHWNRALVWLLQGDLERGWDEMEWRWKLKHFPQKLWSQPLWDGSPLHGRTIVLRAEQGLGDTVQFVRYAPLVKERGGKVILCCHAPLLRLLAGFPGVDQLVPSNQPPTDFDVWIPLMSLPRVFATTLATIPAAVPYLHADPQLVERWNKTLAAYPGFRIGIAWKGSAANKTDHQRSIPLAGFAPLAAVPGVRLISLQKGPGSEQIKMVPFEVIDLGDQLDAASGPFMDTAAVMKNLDLVISCDSAPAHLAGALGVPVWLALPFSPDWRWLLEREDSPWYPTMRLFRQPRPGAWEPLVQRMAEAL
jgi:tetratricopeptide (TPR) repeat protein